MKSYYENFQLDRFRKTKKSKKKKTICERHTLKNKQKSIFKQTIILIKIKKNNFNHNGPCGSRDVPAESTNVMKV